MNSIYVLIALIPTVFFWLLDGFFLHQEKLFRELYDDIRTKESKSIDFSMDTRLYKAKVKSWISVCFSKTLCLFYIPILIVILIVVWVLPNLTNVF